MKNAENDNQSSLARRDGVEIVSEIQDSAFENQWYEYAIENHFWLQWRLAALSKQLKSLGIPLEKELKVFDIGCGCGILRNQIEAISNWVIDGADLNLEALSKAKPRRGKILYYDIYDEQNQFMEVYDIVILFDILEHIHDVGSFIKSALRHLKKNGYLLVNVPALQMFYSNYDTIMGHLRRYNLKTLSKMFEGFNFKIIDVRYWGLSMLPLLALRKLIMSLRPPDTQTVKCGFNPPNVFANSMLKQIMRLETNILSKPLWGTSVLLAGKKL